ncbi:hypothetical protein DFH29DRAFT_882453 [Suillus ampliporus]|nr:hypothetical protein DFH29DRAFT_882453 [Suillus ampliporus]
MSRDCLLGHQKQEPFQIYKGVLNFTMDAWMSSNHQAFIAVTVHFEQDGEPILIQQFDVLKGQADKALKEAEIALKEFTDGLDIKEDQTTGEWEGGDEENIVNEAKDTEGWIDEVANLSIADHDKLEESIRPVKLVLVKLQNFAFALLHSTTLLLPLWFQILTNTGLPECKMPREVVMHWNSTFNMLAFATVYCKAIDDLTTDKTANLHKYELDDNEWEIATQLQSTLKIFKDATLFFS